MIRKHGLPGLAALIVMILCMLTRVNADTGPKPSLAIQCEGFPDNAYITVLSTVKDYGPNTSQTAMDYEIREEEWYAHAPADREVYSAFADEAERLRKTGEELYFWGVVSSCAEEYLFGYWPPEEYRVLVWLRDTDDFILSEDTYSRPAFRTVLKCEYRSGSLDIKDVSDTGISAPGMAMRVFLTIAVEYAVGLMFMKYTFKSRIAVFSVNVLTQILLNAALSNAALIFGSGMPMYLAVLLVTELLIILLEWLIYRKVIGKDLEYPLQYSVLANVLSYGAGIMMAGILPGLFT